MSSGARRCWVSSTPPPRWVAARDGYERLGFPGAPARARDHLGGGGLGSGDHRLRLRVEPSARALLPRPRRSRGHDQRRLSGTLWNQTIPDRLRGRLAGIEQVSYSSGPLLGNLEAGVVASLASVRASVVSGGILCVVGVGLFALALPAFRHYDSRVPQADNPLVGAL